MILSSHLFEMKLKQQESDECTIRIIFKNNLSIHVMDHEHVL